MNDPIPRPTIRGERNHAAVLADADVASMRELRFGRGISTRTLAVIFKVNRSTAWRATAGETFRHLNSTPTRHEKTETRN